MKRYWLTRQVGDHYECGPFMLGILKFDTTTAPRQTVYRWAVNRRGEAPKWYGKHTRNQLIAIAEGKRRLGEIAAHERYLQQQAEMLDAEVEERVEALAVGRALAGMFGAPEPTPQGFRR